MSDIGKDAWHVVCIFASIETLVRGILPLSKSHRTIALRELSARALHVANLSQATFLFWALLKATQCSGVVYEGKTYQPRPNQWFYVGSKEIRGEHDPALSCRGGWDCCWEDDQEHSRKILTEEEFTSFALGSYNHRILEKLRENPPDAYQPLVPDNPDQIRYICSFDFRFEEIELDGQEAVSHEFIQCIELNGENTLVELEKSVVLLNSMGENSDHRGSDHMNIDLPFQSLVSIEAGFHTVASLA